MSTYKLKACLKKNAVIMDACPFTRSGIRQIINMSFDNVNIVEAVNMSNVSNYLLHNKADYVVMDLCGQDESVLQGFRILCKLLQQQPNTHFIICTEFQNKLLLSEISRMKIAYLCSKTEAVKYIKKTLSTSFKGKQKVSPVISRRLKYRQREEHWLTEKEMIVMKEIFDGHNVTEISMKLFRNIGTVSTHKRNAMLKLSFRNDRDMFVHGQWLYKNSVTYL